MENKTSADDISVFLNREALDVRSNKKRSIFLTFDDVTDDFKTNLKNASSGGYCGLSVRTYEALKERCLCRSSKLMNKQSSLGVRRKQIKASCRSKSCELSTLLLRF